MICHKMYYSLTDTKSLSDSSSESYVNHIAINATKSQLAVNLSNQTIQVLDTKTLKSVSQLKTDESLNSVVKYSMQNPNHLFVSTADAIRVYDLRHKAPKCAKQFRVAVGSETNINDQDFNELNCNQFLCFDINSDFTYLCAGTESTEKDKTSYLYFWDIRRPALVLGTYFESHTNDITDVCFHPTKRHMFASGSSDELINIFDLNEPDEDEALTATLNVESAVDRIHWSSHKDNHLVCITQDESAQLWDIDEALPTASFSGLSSSHGFDYVIDYLPNLNQVFVGDKNHAIRLFDISADRSENRIQFVQTLSEGHNKMVRTVAADSDNWIIYSGGEDGVVSVWNGTQSSDHIVHKSQTKGKTKMRAKEKSRSQPY